MPKVKGGKYLLQLFFLSFVVFEYKIQLLSEFSLALTAL